MDETTLLSKCVSVNSNEVSTRIDAEDMGFEKEVWPGIHIVGIVLFVLLGIIVVLCCCIRFRVPRTKQEIEADYIRKRITKNFRNELSKISNTEMNEMDLWKGNDTTAASRIASYENSPWTEFETSVKRTHLRYQRNVLKWRIERAFVPDSTPSSVECECVSTNKLSCPNPTLRSREGGLPPHVLKR
ncbi:uncharacterized protein [Cardiocondyla obscurior]|uniref:uncharacterized protein isoform X1 n=1 Tax=Cardiocondyla obscurior TaxID=286306 RepID=UPI0039657B76